MRLFGIVFSRGCLAFALSAVGLSAGQLAWERTTVELAATPDDRDLVAEFVFKNESDRPVTIASVEASCDCTTVELAQRRYAPGERGRLRVRLEIGDLAGRIERTVSVVTDDPDRPSVPLRLIATIPEFLRIQPAIVRWRVGGEATERIVTCTAAPGQQVSLRAVESGDPNIVASLETVEAGRIYRVHLRPRTTAAHVAATLELQGEVARLGWRTFHAYAYVSGR